MTSKPGDNSEKLTSKSRLLGLVASIAMLGVAGWALLARCANFAARPEMQSPDMNEIGRTMMGTGVGQYLLPFEAVSVLLLACIIGGVVIARKR